MKTSTKTIQFFIGVIPVAIFLVIAAISQDIISLSNPESFAIEDSFSWRFGFDVANNIAVSMFLCMFLWVYFWAILCKWFKSDFIYYGALTGLILPAASTVINGFFIDDGNILSWIYMFTIGLILYPIGRLNYFAFDGINSFFDFDYHYSTIAIIIIIIGLMSLLLFRSLKKKQLKPTPNT